MYSPFLFPGLWEDAQIEGLAAVAEAVHRHGCKLAVQLLHVGLRAGGGAQDRPGLRRRRDVVHGGAQPDPAGRVPGRADAQGARGARDPQILDGYESAARRAIAAGLDGVEFHMAHGYLPVAVPVAALQPAHRSLGQLLREPAALLGRGDAAHPIGDRRQGVARLPRSTRPPSGRATSSRPTSSASSPTSTPTRRRLRRASRRACTTRSSTRRWSTRRAGSGSTPATIKEVTDTPVLLVGRITTPRPPRRSAGRQGRRRDPAGTADVRRRRLGQQGRCGRGR